MTDVVKIQDGKVALIWRGTTIAALNPNNAMAPMLHEFESGEAEIGMLFDGVALSLPAAPAPTTAALLDYAGKKRWAVETGGFVFNGMTIATDSRSQGKVSGAFSQSKADANFKVYDWKLAPGVYIDELNAASIIAIGDAVVAHVQACFSAERAIAEAIIGGTITTFAEIDAATWPPNA